MNSSAPALAVAELAEAALLKLLKVTKPYTAWPPELVSALATIGVKVSLAKGQALPLSHMGLPVLNLLQSGVLEIVVPLANGRELALGYLHPGAIVGMAGAFAFVAPDETTELLAEVDCIVWRFPAGKFKELMRQNWQFAETILGIEATRIGMGIDAIANASVLAAEARVARCLLKSLRDDEFRVYWAKSSSTHLNVTQAQLARMLGLSRQSVGTILRVFEQKGLIEMRRQQITVLDPTVLSEIVHGPAPSNSNG